MTQQLQYLRNYVKMAEDMLAAFPEDEAMERAVGGNYTLYGVLEHCVLLSAGLHPEASCMDVGCGSGRLAVQLSRYPGLSYHGTDVVQSFLGYAERKCGRPDFRFTVQDGYRLPAADETQDFVTFFSVFTHMLHEESYAFLAEAMRVLKPGGKAVFSFLDPMKPHNWPIFAAAVKWVQDASIAGHLNVFIHPQQLAVWAERLGAQVELIVPGDEASIKVGRRQSDGSVAAGNYAFGQSIALVRKPFKRVAEGKVTGAVDQAPSPMVLNGWAKWTTDPARRLRVEVTQYGKVIGDGETGLERPEGNIGFNIKLRQPMEDHAALRGHLKVWVFREGGEPMAIPFTGGLRSTLRRRLALRCMSELASSERTAVVSEMISAWKPSGS